MRIVLLVAFGVATMGMSSYAATIMQVKATDGKVEKYEVDNVETVNIVHEDAMTPQNYPTHLTVELNAGNQFNFLLSE